MKSRHTRNAGHFAQRGSLTGCLLLAALTDASAAASNNEDRNLEGIQLNAVNLFDKYYYATCSQYGYCTNGSRRTVNLTGSYRFR